MQQVCPKMQASLDPVIPASCKPAWEKARANFDNRVFFYAPSIKRYETAAYQNSSHPFFIPVSVTGGSCQLKCEHCRGKILKAMHAARTPAQLLQTGEQLARRGGEGILVSGGSRLDGTVPLINYLEAIRALKKLGLKVAVHTGLVDERLAYGLAEAGVDAAMLDIIGLDETIESVYHLNVAATEFEKSLKLLCQSGVKTSPHLVLGLDFGSIKGEPQALAMISDHDIWSLVLVVITPQPETPMAEVVPPRPAALGKLFIKARGMFPRVPILLGCARPAGDHKTETDALALKSGLNGIAYPAEGIAELAVQLGLKPKFSEHCCSLIFQDEINDDGAFKQLASR